MEQVRIEALEGLVEAIGDTRSKLNRLNENYEGLKASALEQLQKHDLYIYRGYGVVISRMSGGEKLSIRLAPDETAHVAADEKGEASE